MVEMTKVTPGCDKGYAKSPLAGRVDSRYTGGV